jgi:hypothetical protein
MDPGSEYALGAEQSSGSSVVVGHYLPSIISIKSKVLPAGH